ncbi:hypothetical protein pb186bvf_002781 [Paramecium bursaria]
MDQLLDALTSIEKYKLGTKPFKEEAARDPQTCQLINEVVLQVLNKGKPIQKLLALKVFTISKATKLVKEMAELNIQQFHRLLQDQILKVISDYAAFNKDDLFENLFMIPQEQAQLCHSIYRLSCDLIRAWAAWYPNSKFSKTYFNLLTDGVNFPDLKFYKKEQLKEVVDLNKEAKELVNQLNRDKISIWNDQINLRSEGDGMLIEVQEKLQQQLRQVDQALLNVSQSDQCALIQDLLDKQDTIQKQLIQIKLQINVQENQQKVKFNTTPNLEINQSQSKQHLNSKINKYSKILNLTQESDINEEYISEKNYQNDQSYYWQKQTIDFEQIQENNQISYEQKLEAQQFLIDDLQMKYNQLQKDYSQLKEICFQKDIQLLKLYQKLQIYTHKNNDQIRLETNMEDNNNKIYIQKISNLKNKFDDLIDQEQQDEFHQTKMLIKGRQIEYCFKQVSKLSKQQTSLCILNQQGLLFEKKEIKICAKQIPNTSNITLYIFNNDNYFDQQVELNFAKAQNLQIMQHKKQTNIVIATKSSQIFEINYKITDFPFDQQILNIKLLNNHKAYDIILPISIYTYLQFEQITSDQFKQLWNSDDSIRTPIFNYNQLILNDTTQINHYLNNVVLLNPNKLEGYQIGLIDVKYGGAFTFQQCRYLIQLILTPDKQMIIQLNSKEQKRSLSEFILSSFQFLFY